MDGLAGEGEELAKLVECLNKVAKAYGMEISAEKTKLMTNNTSGINKETNILFVLSTIYLFMKVSFNPGILIYG